MKIITAKILEHEPTIGPFFFQECLLVFLSAFSLFFTLLFIACWRPVPPWLLIALPSALLLFMALVRALAASFIHSPWYLHKLLAYRLLAPTKLKAAPLKHAHIQGLEDPQQTNPSKRDPA